jgi:hypothetical protein
MELLVKRLENAVIALEKKTGTNKENKDKQVPTLSDYSIISIQMEKILSKSIEEVKNEDLKK